MKRILWFETTEKKYVRFNPFYKCEYSDIEIPGGIFRTIYCPALINEKETKSFLGRMKPLIGDGVRLAGNGCGFDLDIEEISSDARDIIYENIEKIIMALPQERISSQRINIVIKDESCFRYIMNMAEQKDVDIVIEKGDKDGVEKRLLDECGISMYIERKLSLGKMKDRLSVFMPDTNPPQNAHKHFVLNFSGKECRGSINEKSIVCKMPGNLNEVVKKTGNDIKTMAAIIEYMQYKTNSMSVFLVGIWGSEFKNIF